MSTLLQERPVASSATRVEEARPTVAPISDEGAAKLTVAEQNALVTASAGLCATEKVPSAGFFGRGEPRAWTAKAQID